MIVRFPFDVTPALKHKSCVRTARRIQCALTESGFNPVQSCPHYLFAMQIQISKRGCILACLLHVNKGWWILFQWWFFVTTVLAFLPKNLCITPDSQQSPCLLIPSSSHHLHSGSSHVVRWQMLHPTKFHSKPVSIHLNKWIGSMCFQSSLFFHVCSADTIKVDWMCIWCPVWTGLKTPTFSWD